MQSCLEGGPHVLAQPWAVNELGRWHECSVCGSTFLRPSVRYRILLAVLRARKGAAKRFRLALSRSGHLASAARPPR